MRLRRRLKGSISARTIISPNLSRSKSWRLAFRALIRRSSGETIVRYRIEDLTLDLATRAVRRGSRRIDLTAREFSVLECLMRAPGRVFTRSQLCQHVWEYHFDPESNLVDVYIQRLRRKVDDGEPMKLIQTVRGTGYRIGDAS